MNYVPYHELEGVPNIVVDGAAADSTVLTLSHWPGVSLPEELKADLSAEIAFRYLERPEYHVDVEAVSNNHFDQDGIVGMFALLHPKQALADRELLVDVASAGDFATYRDRSAARIAMTLAALTDPEMSPLDSSVFERSYGEQTATFYREFLPLLPEMLEHPHGWAPYWDEEDAFLDRSEAAIRAGEVAVEEHPEIDLAVITLPQDAPEQSVHRFTSSRVVTCHPMAVCNATERLRLLFLRGSHYELQYRYETWVQYHSRPVLPRVDWAPLAERLQEESGEAWEHDDIGKITPTLQRPGGEASSLSPLRFKELVVGFFS